MFNWAFPTRDLSVMGHSDAAENLKVVWPEEAWPEEGGEGPVPPILNKFLGSNGRLSAQIEILR